MYTIYICILSYKYIIDTRRVCFAVCRGLIDSKQSYCLGLVHCHGTRTHGLLNVKNAAIHRVITFLSGRTGLVADVARDTLLKDAMRQVFAQSHSSVFSVPTEKCSASCFQGNQVVA